MSSTTKKVLNQLKEIREELAALHSLTPNFVDVCSKFAKGDVIIVCTDVLIWSGNLLHIENQSIVLNNATAIGPNGDKVIDTPQLFVDIPLKKIACVAVGQANEVKDEIKLEETLKVAKRGIWRRIETYFKGDIPN